MKIARVFPRKTEATPVDENVFFGPPGFFDKDFDEIHISTTFTWDLKYAATLGELWKDIAPVKHGGPAHGKPSDEFEPGKYLKKGYVITSRGCPNKCEYCSVPKMEPRQVLLKIHDGFIVQDDNILACPENHIREVFTMLSRQDEPATLRGLEARRLKEWHIELFYGIRISQIFFAYDKPEDLEPLEAAGRLLTSAGYNRNKMRSYVYCGYEGDTIGGATSRMIQCLESGFFPFAMAKRDKRGKLSKEWSLFQREWTRPAIIASNYKKLMTGKGEEC